MSSTTVRAEKADVITGGGVRLWWRGDLCYLYGLTYIYSTSLYFLLLVRAARSLGRPAPRRECREILDT